jgi:hypothetical protein
MQQLDDDLYRRVRAAFIIQGTNFSRWCEENGVSRQWAEKVLKGKQNGLAARNLAAQIAQAAGVN